MKNIFVFLSFFASSVLFAEDWQMIDSLVTYQVVHPFHKVIGKSDKAKGKGTCDDKGCHFIVGVASDSFSSGDDNRDQHVASLIESKKYALISWQIDLQSPVKDGLIKVIPTLSFHGIEKKIEEITIKVEALSDGNKKVTGQFAIKMTDFKIEPPSLLFVSTEDHIDFSIESTWRRQ